MKKSILVILALVAFAIPSMASMKVDSVRYLNSTMGQNWFISARGTFNCWQGSMRVPEGFQNVYTKPQWADSKFGFNINFGKWINHKLGLRLSYNNTVINSYIHGRHSRLTYLDFLYGDDPTPVETVGTEEIYKTSMHYHNLLLELMISPIDLFQGYYNAKRVWTPVIYFGAGAAYTSSEFFALKTLFKNTTGNGTNFEAAFSVGLDNNFRLGEHFDINLGLGFTTQRWTIDSWTYEFEELLPDGTTLRPRKLDNMYTASLGLTYYFTRGYDVPDDCADEMQQLRKRLEDCQEELDLWTHKSPDTVPVFIHDTIFVPAEGSFVSYPFSIFFERDSYQLMSGRDLVNLKAIKEVAEKNGCKIRLRGTCDSATGSVEHNQRLAENRCRKIESELEKMGFNIANIIMDPAGGVSELTPSELDRRVFVELVKTK